MFVSACSFGSLGRADLGADLWAVPAAGMARGLAAAITAIAVCCCRFPTRPGPIISSTVMAGPRLSANAIEMGSLSIPDLLAALWRKLSPQVMVVLMLARGHKFKVLWSVVCLHAVDVMYVLASGKRAADNAAHNKAMLPDVSVLSGHRISPVFDEDITSRIDRAPALPCWIGRARSRALGCAGNLFSGLVRMLDTLRPWHGYSPCNSSLQYNAGDEK